MLNCFLYKQLTILPSLKARLRRNTKSWNRQVWYLHGSWDLTRKPWWWEIRCLQLWNHPLGM